MASEGVTWPKLIFGAFLTAVLSVGGNQYFEKVRADGEIRQETRKKQISDLENCRKSLEQLNAPLIVIKGRGLDIKGDELKYEVGRVTTAMERLYDDSLLLDPALQSSKKIAELNDSLTADIRKQQASGADGIKQFVNECKTNIATLVSATKDAIQQDWQTMTNP